MPLDNAIAESFFFYLKRQELSLYYYDMIEDFRRDVDKYVDFF